MYHCIISLCMTLHALNPTADSTISRLPAGYLKEVQKKSHRVERLVSRRADKALDRFSRKEKKLRKRLWKVDSTAANNIFNHTTDDLNGLKKKIPGSGGGLYLDTLQNSLKYLEANDQLLDGSKDQLTKASQSVQDLQGTLMQAEQIKAYMRERRQQLQDQLAQYTGFSKGLQQMNKDAYYYGQQLNEYKAVLKDKKKAEEKAMTLLKTLPAYNDFLAKHGQLAGLFNLTGSAPPDLSGLQTRSQVEQLLQQQLGNDPVARQAVSQQMEQARSQFTALKNKFPDLDNAGDLPNFIPHPLKTKSFFQRLEFGGNVQFQKSTQYYPTTTDIAGQAGYRFHKNGTIGLGVAYKLGMGTGWNNIQFNHQGIGFRSFIDWKLKGTFFINGGFEENYLHAFSRAGDLKTWRGWDDSALLGVSKKYKINTKLKGNIMVLYDFLAAGHVPATSAIKLRMGYNF